MTNILLSGIIVLLIARVVLQIQQGKRAVNNSYCTASEVENRLEVPIPEPKAIDDAIRALGQEGWELISAEQIERRGRLGEVCLFFTRKKIKTYYDERAKD